MNKQLIDRAPVLTLLAAIEDLHRTSTVVMSGRMVGQQSLASAWTLVTRAAKAVKDSEIHAVVDSEKVCASCSTS